MGAFLRFISLLAVVTAMSIQAVQADSGALEKSSSDDSEVIPAFFPVGLYSANIPSMERVSSLGFNTVVGDADTDYIQTAARHGLKVVANSFFQDRPGDTERVAIARGFSNVIAQVVVDEPDIYGKSAADVAQWSERLRVLDPDHPVYLTTWSPKNYGRFKKYADIFAVTPYPVHADNFKDTDLNLGYVYIAMRTALTAPPFEVPVWAAIQCFGGLPTWPRHPSPGELRSMVYQALVAGAGGILYYAMSSGEPYPMADGSTTWNLFGAPDVVDEIRILNAELRELGSILVSGSRPSPPRNIGSIVATRIISDSTAVYLFANTGYEGEDAEPITISTSGYRDEYRIHGRGLKVEKNDEWILIRCGNYCGGSVALTRTE